LPNRPNSPSFRKKSDQVTSHHSKSLTTRAKVVKSIEIKKLNYQKGVNRYQSGELGYRGEGERMKTGLYEGTRGRRREDEKVGSTKGRQHDNKRGRLHEGEKGRK
jgi:hypothetical protein